MIFILISLLYDYFTGLFKIDWILIKYWTARKLHYRSDNVTYGWVCSKWTKHIRCIYHTISFDPMSWNWIECYNLNHYLLHRIFCLFSRNMIQANGVKHTPTVLSIDRFFYDLGPVWRLSLFIIVWTKDE